MASEYEHLEIETFASAWRLQRTIWRIENITLPFPVSFDQIWVFATTEAVLYLLRHLPIFRLIMTYKPVFWWLFLPFGVSWYLSRRALDGKPTMQFLRSILRYTFSPRRFVRYRPLRTPPFLLWRAWRVRTEIHLKQRRAGR